MDFGVIWVNWPFFSGELKSFGRSEQLNENIILDQTVFLAGKRSNWLQNISSSRPVPAATGLLVVLEASQGWTGCRVSTIFIKSGVNGLKRPLAAWATTPFTTFLFKSAGAAACSSCHAPVDVTLSSAAKHNPGKLPRKPSVSLSSMRVSPYGSINNSSLKSSEELPRLFIKAL